MEMEVWRKVRGLEAGRLRFGGLREWWLWEVKVEMEVWRKVRGLEVGHPRFVRLQLRSLWGSRWKVRMSGRRKAEALALALGPLAGPH